jgi:hypothetical protein
VWTAAGAGLPLPILTPASRRLARVSADPGGWGMSTGPPLTLKGSSFSYDPFIGVKTESLSEGFTIMHKPS